MALQILTKTVRPACMQVLQRSLVCSSSMCTAPTGVEHKSSPIVGMYQAACESIKYHTSVKYKFKRAGLLLYIQLATLNKHEEFIRKLKLDDSFFTWFLINELHIWMLCRRVNAEKNGVAMANGIVNAMWMDANARSKQLGTVVKGRLKNMKFLEKQFIGSTLAYDESVEGDDKMLAGALIEFLFTEPCEPLLLESSVEYVRKNMQMLEAIPFEKFANTKYGENVINWKILKTNPIMLNSNEMLK